MRASPTEYFIVYHLKDGVPFGSLYEGRKFLRTSLNQELRYRGILDIERVEKDLFALRRAENHAVEKVREYRENAPDIIRDVASKLEEIIKGPPILRLDYG